MIVNGEKNVMQNRMIETNLIDEDIKIEGSLRPQTLVDYIGQEKVKNNLRVYIEAAKQRGTLWIMYFFTDLPGLEKPPLQALLPMKWVCI